MTLAIASLISLIFGLITPILMVTIHKEVEHLGDVILSFESKGILGSISKLFESGEIAVAITILLFSVIVPLAKIVTLIFTIIFRDYRFSHHLVEFFRHIGKWSMIDVFVVATLLVYLTSNKGSVSHAEIEVGLYFFLAYVILSMVTTIKMKRVISPSSRQHALEMP
nr:paraquat-inducible protein A [Sulfurovum sp. bin170]